MERHSIPAKPREPILVKDNPREKRVQNLFVSSLLCGAIMPVQEDYFYSMVSPSKEIQDSLSVDEIFGFHAVDSRLQPLDWILSQ